MAVETPEGDTVRLTAWQALGSQVTMLVRSEAGLLPRMEPFAGGLVAEGLREAGVDVRLGTSVISVTRQEPAPGEVGVELKAGTEMTADEMLFAIGRTPQTGKPGLETVGLTPGDRLRGATPAG
ncbi:hypothetical protein GCM10010300_74170 [Streptomyces olivaceoviridis]|nr:hypothetical protein GCM10010300_74170 [Streptomyces olivaceoviridis]